MTMPRFNAESALYRSSIHYQARGPLAATADIEQTHPLAVRLCAADGLALCALDAAAAIGIGTCRMTFGSAERITDFSTTVGDLTLVGHSHANLGGADKQFTLTVSGPGGTVMQIDSSFSSTGTYTTDLHYGAMVKGVRQATFVTQDGKLVQGTIDGRRVKPFTAGSRSVTFADGAPVPRPIFPPDVSSALQLAPAAVKKALGTCIPTRGSAEPTRPSSSQSAIRLASNGTSTFGSPPRVDDTANTKSCDTCLSEAFAAAVGCGIACGASFGLGCGCIAGIPFLFLNCHTVGEQFGQGCCPVACASSQTILGVGVVFQCCFGGDSCLNPGVPVVGGSSTAAFCCGPGLQTCNQSICCPSDAPCRDVGICCPTNQNTCVTASGPLCCDVGEDCIQNVGCCSPANVCGTNCCDEFSTCVDPNTGTCCPDLTGIVCGNQCCDGTTERCTATGCCPIAQACNGICCPAGSICSNGQCISGCPDGEDFSTAPDGTVTCCPLFQCVNPSNDNICVENSCPGGVCCGPNQVCCPTDIPDQFRCADPPCISPVQ
jgi:hypothetical protein